MQDIVFFVDLCFFFVLVMVGSFFVVGCELGLIMVVVSKYFMLMEVWVGVLLVNCIMCCMMLMFEGELYLEYVCCIFDQIDELFELLGSFKCCLEGLLWVNVMLGFGCSYVVLVIFKFVMCYLQVLVQLQLLVMLLLLIEDSFDVCICFGELFDIWVVVWWLVFNVCLLCVLLDYFRCRGMLQMLYDLVKYNCVGICQGDEVYGVWKLFLGSGVLCKMEMVKICGNFIINDGEIVVKWVLDGYGIFMCVEWDICSYLEQGWLVQVLLVWQMFNVDIFVVYLQCQQLLMWVCSFVDFIVCELVEFLFKQCIIVLGKCQLCCVVFICFYFCVKIVVNFVYLFSYFFYDVQLSVC